MEVLFGFLGVLIGSAIPWIKEEWHRHRSRKADGQFLAVRIISMLDEYAEKCVGVVSDDGTLEGRPAGRTDDGEEFYIPQITCPEPPIFPDDIDWKCISFELMYRALALPKNARDTDRYISASAEHAFPPDYDELFAARQEGYARLGLEALDLVSLLRKEFDLPESPPKFWNKDWDAKVHLKEKLEQIEQRREINADIYNEITQNAGKPSKKQNRKEAAAS